jgi:type II secretory ATPase GspE/PulE/Tfp pilus assembly ATPase PilB-like protein
MTDQPITEHPLTDVAASSGKLDELISALKAEGVSEHHIQIATRRQAQTREDLTQIMHPSQLGFLSAEGVARVSAKMMGHPYKSILELQSVPASVIKKALSDKRIELKNMNFGVPISINGRLLGLAIAQESHHLDAHSVFAGFDLDFVVVSTQTLSKLWRLHYSNTHAQMSEMLAQLEQQVRSQTANEQTTGPTLDSQIVRRSILTVLRHGCFQQMSDIEFTATSDQGGGMLLGKRFGSGHLLASLTKPVWDLIWTYLVGEMSATDPIKEGPVDRLMEFKDSDIGFEDISTRFTFRVSLMKRSRNSLNQGGITFRILDSQAQAHDFDQLGFDDETREEILSITRRTDGLFLVTGPTGSGKTTTLYSILDTLDPIQRWIKTIEYPIEYARGTWRQFAIDDVAAGRSSQASHQGVEGAGADRLLKGLLRAAPDVILYGEIRSADIAKSLVTAATTGHLCFSTLHNNDAGSALNRLHLLGLDMTALADVLRGVLALRLVRTLCACAEPDERSGVQKVLDEATYLGDVIRQPRRPLGCVECDWSGYTGRRLVYELLVVTPEVQDQIEQGVSARRIAEKAIPTERSIKASALRLVATGQTCLDEVKALGVH